jgi:hypothetical protein
MGTTETWLALLGSAAVLYAAFEGGGRIVDWILDRLFVTTPSQLWMGTDEEESP